jgi:branched-chain amino acid transport system ATP-binding protein
MLEVQNLFKSFGGVAAIAGVSLAFPAGSLTAIIGPNGAGKSTFFNLISGGLKPDSGRVLLDGIDLVGKSRAAILRAGIGRSFQVAKIFRSLTVEETLLAAVASHQGRSADLWHRFPLAETVGRVQEVASMLGLDDKLAVLSGQLSHGDQKLLDVALALVLKPRVLLLDEPTAGMGSDERWRMIEKVYQLWETQKITLIFIEHDMDIVFKFAPSIRVLCYGRVLAEGDPDEIRNNPAVIEAYLGASYERVAAA